MKYIKHLFSRKWRLKEGFVLIEELILSTLLLIKFVLNSRNKERNLFRIVKNKENVKRYF